VRKKQLIASRIAGTTTMTANVTDGATIKRHASHRTSTATLVGVDDTKHVTADGLATNAAGDILLAKRPRR